MKTRAGRSRRITKIRTVANVAKRRRNKLMAGCLIRPKRMMRRAKRRTKKLLLQRKMQIKTRKTQEKARRRNQTFKEKGSERQAREMIHRII